MQSQGVIRVFSESPYEHLDPATAEWVNHLKQMWPLWKKNAVIYDMLFNFFSRSENPFMSALQIMATCGDFYSGKLSSLAYHVMETFSNWLLYQPPREIPSHLKLDALSLVTRQKSFALIKLVAETYRMTEDKEIFVDYIKQLCSNKKYKEACQLAGLLNLQDYFEIEEFVVPLVFQDKYVLAEQFLEGSKKHQVALAVFLDDVIGKKSVMMEVQSIIAYLNIPDVRHGSLKYKPLSKLLGRIMKTFNIPAATCPNLNQNRGKGILQFLLNKKYIEKTIGGESWTEMVLEAIGDDKFLQEELIEKLPLYGDCKEALVWAERFGIPVESWPQRLVDFSQSSQKEGNQSAEENWDDDMESVVGASVPLPMKFHKFPLEESQIKVVDTASGFYDFILALSNGISVVGIDAEWKPSFGLKKCDLALIQIAAFHVVYILDILALATEAPQVLWERFASAAFENPNLLKLGFGINADMAIVKDTLWKLHGIKMGRDANFLDLSALWKTLVNDYKFVFPFASTSKSSENLNTLIEMCLGESLDKSDQFSNWENRPLRKSQIVYAALDAYCLLEAYNVMLRESESQNIPISAIIEEIVDETVAKKTATSKKKKGGKSQRRDLTPRRDASRDENPFEQKF